MTDFPPFVWLGGLVAKWRGPRAQLERSCRALRELVAGSGGSGHVRGQALHHYLAAVGFAAHVSPDKVVRVVREFGRMFAGRVEGGAASLRHGITVLKTAQAVSFETLEAAEALCRQLGDQAELRRAEQELCLWTARAGYASGLLRKLVARRKEGSLPKEELHAIIKAFVEARTFEKDLPWKEFFLDLPEALLPPVHQVYSLLDRPREAADLAETALDLRSALEYLAAIPGTEAALRTLALAEKVSDATAANLAHGRLGECLRAEGKFGEAADHFRRADQMEHASDCYLRAGKFRTAIQLRPAVQSEWVPEARSAIESAVRKHLAAREFIEAARLLWEVESAWQEKLDHPERQSEAERARRLLSEVVKTGRAALGAEARSAQGEPGLEVFKRWSLFEEAAGNLLEAGVQAEVARDYFAASLLFEKAGAFGQALSALRQAAGDADPRRRAELLERGGDFFMAGLIHERLGDIDKAIAMFREAREFARAADLRRKQVGESAAAFDEGWLELLTKAERVETLAELCMNQARTPGCPGDQRARLYRRVKQLADRGLVGSRLADQVASELPRAEAANKASFDNQVGEWAMAASREVRETYLDCFGLDLGTSNSVVALFSRKKGQAEVVECRGRQTIPSVFAIDQEGLEVVGIAESELLGKAPRGVVTRAKRRMGTDSRFKVDGQLFRPEEISARIIGHARAVAVEHLLNKIGERVASLAAQAMGAPPPSEWVSVYVKGQGPALPLNKAVITVPAYFNEAQKQATRTAATLANVSVLRLIHEPTAACIAQRSPSGNMTLLVVDLGAGTLDLSLLEVGSGVYEVLEIEGDNALGSSDLDEMLQEHLLGGVNRQIGEGAVLSGLANKRLHQACEELKIELSSHSEWSVKLPRLAGDKTVELTMHRDELERLAAPWLGRIRQACRKIKGRPKRVLLVGGGALMPAVGRCVKEVFGLDPSPGVDPLTAVARGAALQAAMLLGELKDFLVLDATPFSLGVKSYVSPEVFKFDVLIPKHSTIPKETTSTYTTVTDDQRAVRIQVFQGESSDPDRNFKIGEFALEGLLPAKAGTPKIDVTFQMDANCLLRVTARDTATNREQQITIADSNLLTPAQVASLHERVRHREGHQVRLSRLQGLAAEATERLRVARAAELPRLQLRFQELLRLYEAQMGRYAPTGPDNATMLEAYRERNELESRARLALDRWDTLEKSAEAWLARKKGLDLRNAKAEQIDAVVSEGDGLLRRLHDGAKAILEAADMYRRWSNVIQGLPVNPEGDADDVARHFLKLGRYDEALAHFHRLGSDVRKSQVELGLEILARLRRREDYVKLLTEHSGLLDRPRPDFVRLNQSVRVYAPSVVCIQARRGAGSGFAVSPSEVATNRHVVVDESTQRVLSPEEVRVVAKDGIYRVASIHRPAKGNDDVAILRLAGEARLTPLSLGYSELVEVGERILTLGFPAPGPGGFEENLYCNSGLVNRIRPSELCSERVLEVSVELQGGISGAPILNELGEVVGLVTFTQMRAQALEGGAMNVERSFFAIPVEVLRRLRAEISTGASEPLRARVSGGREQKGGD